MLTAVSNIAWRAEEAAAVLPLLRARGVSGVEVAPTTLWPGWEGATPRAAAEWRRRLDAEGFAVPALQAVLYGLPGLALFAGEEARAATASHLCRVADLCAAFGAGVAVLGAPAARRRGLLGAQEAEDQAAEFFSALAAEFAARGAVLAIEPNPPSYACDFVTTAAEGARLVAAVGKKGFSLHLDAAGIALSGDDPAAAVRSLAGRFVHFHASEPDLGGFASPGVDHAAVGEALAGAGYRGWVSLEMRRAADPLRALEAACDVLRAAYGER